MAAQSGHTDIVSVLLDRGVDINTTDKVQDNAVNQLIFYFKKLDFP